MKKTIIKMSVFLLTFLVSLLTISGIMNLGNYNMTAEMAPASLPVIVMQKNGQAYNELHGYVKAMDVACQRETITELGENRELEFVIDTYGTAISGIRLEVRSADGSRLVEESDVTDISVSDGQIQASAALKDLLERDTEYSLTILLQTEREEPVRYYTRAVWSSATHAQEKLAFALDFHETVFSEELAREKGIATYLESDATGDNSTFHKVNIHSSFSQITWGELNVREVAEPRVRITELNGQMGSLLVDSYVCTGQGEDAVYYTVEEYFRVRFPEGAERLYLLDYERTVDQIPNMKGTVCVNDKIILGIADENKTFRESEDGTSVVFEMAGRLFGYQETSNKMAVIFGFYDEDHQDARDLYPQHRIKVWNVEEGGSLYFAVYGYMNRGPHEGEVGVQVFYYDAALNMVEEMVFLPYKKSESVLEQEMEQLLYMNRDGQLYLMLNQSVFCVDVRGRSWVKLVTIDQDGGMRAADDHHIIVWQEGEDAYHGDRLVVMNLDSGERHEILARDGEAVRPLGFMGDDIIYGTAREEDISRDLLGTVFSPMYKAGICDDSGELLKESREEGILITGCSVTDNQIALERVTRTGEGRFQEATPEYIMSNAERKSMRNTLTVAVIDVYEKYVQIQTPSVIDEKGLQILTPREAVYEGSRELELDTSEVRERYYVYGAYGVEGIFLEVSPALRRAYQANGSVIDEKGSILWSRSSRRTRKQIEGFTQGAQEPEDSEPAACLDAILRREGAEGGSAALLRQGYDAAGILRERLPGVQVLNLGGCSLDMVLYYVNQDAPVLAFLDDGGALLITGYNEYNIIVADSATGKTEYRGMNDSAALLEENGNRFLTYIAGE